VKLSMGMRTSTRLKSARGVEVEKCRSI
jgi:hypothetical protein